MDPYTFALVMVSGDNGGNMYGGVANGVQRGENLRYEELKGENDKLANLH